MDFKTTRIAASHLVLGLSALFCAPALAESNVLFIFDASGSMKKAMPSGESRMDAAKKAMGGALATMPADVRLGLLLYGHRRAKDCTDIELVSPIGADDGKAIGARINALTAKGETPIAESLKQGMRSYAALKGQDNRMILVTDGIEECGGNVCAAAQEVRDAGFDLKVDVVGFTLSPEQRALIQCVPDVTGGQYYDAQNMAGLSTALQKAVEPPDNNILAAKNGGRLLSAPNDEWQKLNDGDDKRATTYNGAGVWSFKDGKPATFDTFEVLIPAADQYNLKDFELLVGDEGPLGSFRSIGQFSAQNMKMMKTPYQPFKFEPVTARYLKVVLNTDQGGGYIAAHEFRVQGTVDAAAEGRPAATAPAGIDLLAPANGGQLLAAPFDSWNTLTNGKADRATSRAGDGIWSFKDGKPATFDTFEVLIPGTESYNLKDFELLVGDEGPLGSFRSIGQFSTQNVKMMPDGWQRFSFAPVTGRYLKIGFRTDHGGGYIAAYDVRLFGILDEAAAATAKAAAPTGVDLLSPANGGQLLLAPSDSWATLTNGKPDRATSRAGDGVWMFKDGKPATFDTFAVLIPENEQYNLKDFELLAGDEGALGSFRSIGQFTTQNMKVMPDAWQRFSFAPVTARYLKVGFRSDHGGGYIAAYDLRLFGTLDAAATGVAQVPAPQGINLLAQANGGALLGGPDESWALLNDGKEDGRMSTRAGGEGIWAFKDEKPATFDSFEMLIHGADQYNLKDFELLAAVDSPAGPFLSLGQFTAQNARAMPAGYQRFSFAPATARYFKVVMKSDQGGGYIAAHEFRLFGQPAP